MSIPVCVVWVTLVGTNDASGRVGVVAGSIGVRDGIVDTDGEYVDSPVGRCCSGRDWTLASGDAQSPTRSPPPPPSPQLALFVSFSTTDRIYSAAAESTAPLVFFPTGAPTSVSSPCRLLICWLIFMQRTFSRAFRLACRSDVGNGVAPFLVGMGVPGVVDVVVAVAVATVGVLVLVLVLALVLSGCSLSAMDDDSGGGGDSSSGTAPAPGLAPATTFVEPKGVAAATAATVSRSMVVCASNAKDGVYVDCRLSLSARTRARAGCCSSWCWSEDRCRLGIGGIVTIGAVGAAGRVGVGVDDFRFDDPSHRSEPSVALMVSVAMKDKMKMSW